MAYSKLRGNRPAGVRPHGTKGKYHGKGRGYAGTLSDAAGFTKKYAAATPKGQILVAKKGGYKAGEKLAYMPKKVTAKASTVGAAPKSLATGPGPKNVNVHSSIGRPKIPGTGRRAASSKLYGRTVRA